MSAQTSRGVSLHRSICADADCSVRILRRVQAAYEHQDVEDVHRRVQRATDSFHRRVKDLLCAWWTFAKSEEYGRYPAYTKADGCVIGCRVTVTFNAQMYRTMGCSMISCGRIHLIQRWIGRTMKEVSRSVTARA